MKIPLHLLPAFLITLLCVPSLPAEPQIKLTGRKDLVLSVESRQIVLEVARQNLSEPSGAFMSMIEEAKSPYAFDKPVVSVIRDDGAVIEKVEEAAVNYDDASVLNAVSQNFSKQVRGTLARGATSFLQLKGGSMIRPGTSFPVNIPQAQGQTFTVTIKEISSDSYTLQLGEATQTIRLNASSASGSGAIKFD